MTVRHFVGLDLGPPTEPTGLAVVARPKATPDGPPPAYDLRHLQRFPPGTPYPEVIAAVVRLLRTPLDACWLLADYTGVGWAVQELLADGLEGRVTTQYSAVAVSAGNAVAAGERGGLVVPKADLVGTLQVLLQTRRLRIPVGLPYADDLVRDLGAYRPRAIAPADAAAWRDAPHDDLVFAVALAAWGGEQARPR